MLWTVSISVKSSVKMCSLTVGLESLNICNLNLSTSTFDFYSMCLALCASVIVHSDLYLESQKIPQLTCTGAQPIMSLELLVGQQQQLISLGLVRHVEP